MIKYKEFSPICLTPDIPYDAQDWRNDYVVRKWCRQHTLIDKYQQNEWIEDQSEDQTTKMFGIHNGQRHVGVCGLTSINLINRNAEFSLYIAPSHRGKKYGKIALSTLLKHGFEDWGLNRIWGETYENNPALKTFLELGFKEEGRLRMSYFREGRFIDSILVGLLAHEFKKGHGWISIV
jgi:diamine N-acetyltransferase